MEEDHINIKSNQNSLLNGVHHYFYTPITCKPDFKLMSSKVKSFHYLKTYRKSLKPPYV